jgi:formylglycine-generating enzyme required for sulfatase activity
VHRIRNSLFVVALAAAVLMAAAPLGAGELETYTNDVGMKFVKIPAGSFIMGAKEGRGEDDEMPAHKVNISKPFYLGVTEVTQAHYEKVMGKNPSRFKGKPKHPVENVSWNDAQAFCKKLSGMDPKGSYRLPTEAEWEYACRAGTRTTYPWGDEWKNEYGWIFRRPAGPTKEVGTLKPNPWGLHDMCGNVWEWCQDFYAKPYLPGEQTDPTGPAEGELRCLRGGSWYYQPAAARCANRRAHPPTRIDGDAGFRVVFEPKG